jgi:hypothetical protein
MGQANTAGHTKKNVQYSILYIGYAVGKCPSLVSSESI